ncbi:monoglyceride lipase-like [Diadema antillarum]|uniref:monoglyceride lipase-like n=1 Tax=Diadema antillarum TaxID=105358 RepID=UPI003A892A3C
MAEIETKEELPEGQKENTFINADNLKIYCKYWYPKEDIKALVHIIHGLGEHCARYDALAESFNKLGCLVFGHDHIGHGRSGGARVDVTAFQKYVADCNQHIDIVTKDHPDLPIIIFGHSMGGTIAILLMNAAPEKYAGGIFMSPATKLSGVQGSSAAIYMGELMARMSPHMPIGQLDISNLSRDPAVVEHYVKDPLVWHGKVKARLAVNVAKACRKIQAECNKATYPFLLLHGTKDKLCIIEGSDLFAKKAASQRKVYKRYEGYYHELEKEPEGEREVVFKDIEEWTKEILSSIKS